MELITKLKKLNIRHSRVLQELEVGGWECCILVAHILTVDNIEFVDTLLIAESELKLKNRPNKELVFSAYIDGEKSVLVLCGKKEELIQEFIRVINPLVESVHVEL